MSFATARLMETWAHGQDVVDALGARPCSRPTGCEHIAHLGVRTRGFSYAIKGLETPDVPVFVALTAPSGEEWTWGEPDADGPGDRPGVGLLPARHAAARARRPDLSVTGDAAAGVDGHRPGVRGRPVTTTDESRRGL